MPHLFNQRKQELAEIVEKSEPPAEETAGRLPLLTLALLNAKAIIKRPHSCHYVDPQTGETYYFRNTLELLDFMAERKSYT